MNRIKREFLGKRVAGLPESVMQVLSMWFMQKSQKVIQVNTNIKEECVGLPKPKYKLCELDDDDEDVFATGIIDRYAIRPKIIGNMCLAEFAITCDCAASKNYENDAVNCYKNTCVGDDEIYCSADVTTQSTMDVRTGQNSRL